MPVCSVSLASLIADTERLLASSTLARDLNDPATAADRDRDGQPPHSDPSNSYPSSSSSPSPFQPSSPPRRPSSPPTSTTSSSIQVRIRSPSPAPHPHHPSGALLFSPLSSRDAFPSPSARPYPPHSLPSIPHLSSSLTGSPTPSTSSQPTNVDITVEYDDDADPSHPRASSPSLHVSISPSRDPSAPTASSSSSSSLSARSSLLRRVAQLLAEHGFRALPVDPAPSVPVLALLDDVLTEYSKRGQLVQELLARDKDASTRELIDKQARRIDELLQAQIKAEVADEERRADARRREREHQRELAALHAKLAVAHQQLQLKEQVVLNLQAEVAAGERGRQTEATAERDVGMFKRLHGREPREEDAADASEMRVIRLYEDRVEEMRREVDFLRKEIGEVNALLTERREEDAKGEEEASTMQGQRTDQVRSLRSELRQRDAAYGADEAKLQARLREAEELLKEREAKVDALEREGRRLSAELELRMDDRQQRDLTVKLRHADAREKELTRELQRLTHLRGARLSSAVTPDNALGLVQQVSAQLGLADAKELPATLEQLLKVVDAVPGMQRFIRSVCDVVMSGRHSGKPSTFGATTEPSSMMEFVLPTLRAWEAQLTQVSSLTELHSRLLSELSRRTHPFHHALSPTTPIELLLTELADLVSSENRLFTLMYGPVPDAAAKHSAASIPDYSSLNAVASAAKMLAHFQHLFDVPHVNGVYPKMNELYVFASEQRVAMGQLRSLLRLGVGVPTAAVVNAVRERLGRWEEEGGVKRLMAGDKDEEEEDVRRRVEAVERGLQAEVDGKHVAEEKNHPPPPSGGGRLGSAERNELLLVELSELLGAGSHAEVPAIVERLLAQLEQLRQKEAAWQRERASAAHAKDHAQVLKQLKRALHVASVADIVPAVQALSASASSASAAAQPIRVHGTVRPPGPAASAAAVEAMAQVKLHLDVAHAADVVPTLKRLLGRLGMYEDVMPSVDRLVTSLYALLGVREIAQILPAVRRLKAHAPGRAVKDSRREEDEDEEEEEEEEEVRQKEEEQEEDDGVEVRIETGGDLGTNVRISSPGKRSRREDRADADTGREDRRRVAERETRRGYEHLSEDEDEEDGGEEEEEEDEGGDEDERTEEEEIQHDDHRSH